MKNVKTMALALAAGVGRGFPDLKKCANFALLIFEKCAKSAQNRHEKRNGVKRPNCFKNPRTRMFTRFLTVCDANPFP